jgi:hypothetical protein
VKFETRTEEDGKVVLKLGLSHEVKFSEDIDLEGIVLGVQTVIEAVTGVSSFDLVRAVIDEFAKGDNPKVDAANDG